MAEVNKIISDGFIETALGVAEKAVRHAGGYLRSAPNSHEMIQAKSSRDHLLRADIEAEKIILKKIQATFPEHGVLAEESGLLREESRFRWIIDPLDGSFNYQREDNIYGIMLGFCVDNIPTIATIYIPERDKLYTAVKARGATCNGRPISVSNINQLENVRLQFGDFAKDDTGYGNTERLEDLKYIAGKVGRVRMVGSAAVDIASVASGTADGLIERNPDKWDILIGGLLITEAGGKASVFETKGTTLYVASNRAIHAHIEELLLPKCDANTAQQVSYETSND